MWWSKDAEAKLGSLSGDEFLHTQLATAFVAASPVWMDSSTSADCRALEEAIGGPEVGHDFTVVKIIELIIRFIVCPDRNYIKMLTK